MNFRFLNPQIAGIHTDFLTAARLYDLDNPSGRNGVSYPKSLR
jgi:hypothetical protein